MMAVVLVSVGGAGLSGWNAWRAEERADGERRAKGEAEAKQIESEAAKAEETKAKDKAIDARDRALDALDAMTSDMTGESLFTQTDLTTEQGRFLGQALPHYRELMRDVGADERTRRRVANAAFRVGMIETHLGRVKPALVQSQGTPLA